MYKVAIIGITGYGKTHLRLLRQEEQAGRVKIVAAVVINPDDAVDDVALLRKNGCEILSSHDELFAKWEGRLDLVCIPTAIRWHAPMAIAAMRAGANVLVEKPLSGTLQEVDAIRAEEQRSGKFVAVGFQDVYASLTHQIKNMMLSGSIGRIKLIKAWALWPRETSYYTRNGWAGRLRQGESWVLDSPLNNALAHFLNLMLFLLGTEPRSSATPVAIQGELYRSKPIESFDTAGVRIQMDSGTEALFLATHSAKTNIDPELWIEGEEGTIRWKFWKSCHIQMHGDSSKDLGIQFPDMVLQQMMNSVLDRIESTNTFVCGPDIARTHTLVINALHDHCPIQNVSDEQVDHIQKGTSDIHTIRGIEDDLPQAFFESMLPSEMRLPWALQQTPAPSKLRHYEQFAGVAKS